MSVDTVITLDNNVNCLLLEKTEFNGANYFMANVLNEEEEPTEDYVIFREILEGEDKYVEKVEDKNVLTELLKLFSDITKKKVDELPEL